MSQLEARAPSVEDFADRRAAGLPIVAPWIDSPINRNDAEPSADAGREHWAKCISSAADADVCLFYAEEGATQCGALIELGAALAASKRVYIVSAYDWSIAHHPRCRTFETLESAIIAIMAAQPGEQARRGTQSRTAIRVGGGGSMGLED